MGKKRTLWGIVVVLVIVAAVSGGVHAAEEDLVWSTYLGGRSNVDNPRAIAVDDSGAVYVTGHTCSENFPVTEGAFDETYHDTFDVFVTKLSPDGSSLVYSTFIGTDQEDQAYAIAVDATGAAYIAGRTGSPDFPTTPGAFDTTYNGGWIEPWDVFVTKLSPDGSTLVYSTFIGGAHADEAKSIVVDATACVYVEGTARSPDFPTTPGAFDTTYNEGPGAEDVFVAKLSADGSTLIYSTFLGGTGTDLARGFTVDAAGYAYVAGHTTSEDFPTTPGSYDPTYNGDWASHNYERDAFVTKLNPDGSGLVYSTYLGGTDSDSAISVALDDSGCAYVKGGTHNADFPTTPGAFDRTFHPSSTGFVVKLTADGSDLMHSTFLEWGARMTLDGAGNVVVVGSTESPDMPTTVDAFDSTLAGTTDAVVLQLSADLSQLLYCTYLGGTIVTPIGIDEGDYPYAVATDASGAMYVTGYTYSPDFPVTDGAFQTSQDEPGDLADGFITKIDYDLDDDGLTNHEENELGTDLFDHDTDNDLLRDDYEVRDLDPDTPDVQNPFDPLDPDSTGDDFQPGPDGVLDGGNDWDGDGMSNRDEFAFGYDPIDPNSWAEVPLGPMVGVSALVLLLLAARRRMAARATH